MKSSVSPLNTWEFNTDPVEEGKEAKMTSEKNIGEERDILSDMPEHVLVHVMKFVPTKDVVRTCVLSKRWKNFWKRVTTLSFMRKHFTSIDSYNEFVLRVLSGRDGSISLLELHFGAHGSEPTLLNKVMKYAVSHNVEHLTITTSFGFPNIPNFFFPLIFSCHSLTFLKFSSGPALELPKSLLLPTVKCLHLTNVSFTPFDNDCAEPFSSCDSLNTLVLQDYSLCNDAQILCISNSTLSCLELNNTPRRVRGPTVPNTSKIVLSTPNLTSITLYIFIYHEVSSTCDLSFLEEVNIDAGRDSLVIMNWLQVLSNVKILTLSYSTLARIYDVSNLTKKLQPPSLVRLESLKLKNFPSSKTVNTEVMKMVKGAAEYLTGTCRVDVLRKLLPHFMYGYLGEASYREFLAPKRTSFGRLSETIEERHSKVIFTLE